VDDMRHPFWLKWNKGRGSSNVTLPRVTITQVFLLRPTRVHIRSCIEYYVTIVSLILLQSKLSILISLNNTFYLQQCEAALLHYKDVLTEIPQTPFILQKAPLLVLKLIMI